MCLSVTIKSTFHLPRRHAELLDIQKGYSWRSEDQQPRISKKKWGEHKIFQTAKLNKPNLTRSLRLFWLVLSLTASQPLMPPLWTSDMRFFHGPCILSCLVCELHDTCMRAPSPPAHEQAIVCARQAGFSPSQNKRLGLLTLLSCFSYSFPSAPLSTLF